MTRPSTRIHAVAELSAARAAELQVLVDAQFANTSFEWAPPQWHVLTSIDDTLVACLRLFERSITASTQRLRLGGVGGVMTLPEWRQRGLASITLRRAAEFLRTDRQLDFAFLLCRDEVAAVYAKLGWQPVAGPTTFQQPTGRATYPQRTMVLALRDAAWPPGPIDLCGLPW
jgi:GNAT superfamily N-acetyltransferase